MRFVVLTTSTLSLTGQLSCMNGFKLQQLNVTCYIINSSFAKYYLVQYFKCFKRFFFFQVSLFWQQTGGIFLSKSATFVCAEHCETKTMIASLLGTDGVSLPSS